MTKRTPAVPAQVHTAAATTWHKWQDKLATVPPEEPDMSDAGFAARRNEILTCVTPEERMIAKIRLRMTQYPEWYETDPAKVAELVATELDRIGALLEKKLPTAKKPVEVWDIPLSVFNWLVEDEHGVSFVHGALSAWSNAECFNSANLPDLTPEDRAHLRANFTECAPVLLKAVLLELMQTNLRITFAKKFVGPELKYLTLRVNRPV